MTKERCDMHDFSAGDRSSEWRTLAVALVTLLTMCVEIAAGYLTGSMALLADGWHMGTHALALGISYAAYRLSRHYAGSPRFGFGTAKFGALAGFTSSLLLGLVAVSIILDSLERLVHPAPISFNNAILVAVIGLVVNAVCLALLHRRDDSHEHEHEHGHEHHHHSHDHNYRAAYVHVLADALTSVMAIGALLSGKLWGWSFMDPVIGLVGGLVIIRWAWLLLCGSGKELLDGVEDPGLAAKVRDIVESDGVSHVTDLHVWPVGAGRLAAVLCVSAPSPAKASDYRKRLAELHQLRHLTVEIDHQEKPD